MPDIGLEEYSWDLNTFPPYESDGVTEAFDQSLLEFVNTKFGAGFAEGPVRSAVAAFWYLNYAIAERSTGRKLL